MANMVTNQMQIHAALKICNTRSSNLLFTQLLATCTNILLFITWYIIWLLYNSPDIHLAGLSLRQNSCLFHYASQDTHELFSYFL